MSTSALDIVLSRSEPANIDSETSKKRKRNEAQTTRRVAQRLDAQMAGGSHMTPLISWISP